MLIYKATTLINFAQGELAMLGGFIVFVLGVEQGLPGWIAVIVAMMLTAALAAGIERTLIRPFDPADHLPLVIITLGLFLMLNAIAVVIWRSDPKRFPELFPSGDVFTWGTTQLRWYDVGVVVSVVVLVIALEALLNKTKIGLAFRAVSSNLESSRLVGIKVGQTLMFGWALAAAVGTLAASLYVSSPLRQLEPDLHVAGADLLDGGGGVGRPRQHPWGTGRWADHGAAPGVLPVRRVLERRPVVVPRHRQRAQPGHRLRRPARSAGGAAQRAVRHEGDRARMSPRVLVQGTPAQRRYTRISWGLFVLFVALVPFAFADTWAPTIFGDTYTIGMDNLLHAIAWMVAVLGLNLLIGYSGQISLGHSFFVGLGAYLSGVLMVSYDWPFLATFPVVIPVCFVFGMIVGIPALRIKGLYLALVTLVLATIFPTLVRLDGWADKTGGSNGLNASVGPSHRPAGCRSTPSPSSCRRFRWSGGVFGSDGLDERGEERVWVYLMMVIIASVMFWMARNIVRSRPGRAFVAIRDNETGAAVSGVNLPLYKTLAFGLSSAYAGVAGVMYTVAIGALAPDVFGINLAIFFIVGLVIGGVATISGAVIGGLAIIFIPHLSSQWAAQTDSLGPLEVTGDRPYGQVLLGAFLILVTFVLPGGVVAGVRSLRARLVVVTPQAPIGTRSGGTFPGEGSGGDDPAPGDDPARPAARRTKGSAALP